MFEQLFPKLPKTNNKKTDSDKEKIVKNLPIESSNEDFSFDYGSDCHVTDSSALDSKIWIFTSMINVVNGLPTHAKRLRTELTSGSYDWDDRNEAIDLCIARGIEFLGNETNATQNSRADRGTEKTDANDAREIFHIGFETKYQCKPMHKTTPPTLDGLNNQRVDVNKLIRIARRPRYDYKNEKALLRQTTLSQYHSLFKGTYLESLLSIAHNMKVPNVDNLSVETLSQSIKIEYTKRAAYWQCVVVANYVLDILHGAIDDYDRLLWGGPCIIRASLKRDLLQGHVRRAKHDINDKSIRKEHLRMIKKETRHIFHLVQESRGTSGSESGAGESEILELI